MEQIRSTKTAQPVTVTCGCGWTKGFPNKRRAVIRVGAHRFADKCDQDLRYSDDPVPSA